MRDAGGGGDARHHGSHVTSTALGRAAVTSGVARVIAARVELFGLSPSNSTVACASVDLFAPRHVAVGSDRHFRHLPVGGGRSVPDEGQPGSGGQHEALDGVRRDGRVDGGRRCARRRRARSAGRVQDRAAARPVASVLLRGLLEHVHARRLQRRLGGAPAAGRDRQGGDAVRRLPGPAGERRHAGRPDRLPPAGALLGVPQGVGAVVIHRLLRALQPRGDADLQVVSDAEGLHVLPHGLPDQRPRAAAERGRAGRVHGGCGGEGRPRGRLQPVRPDLHGPGAQPDGDRELAGTQQLHAPDRR